MLFFFLLSADSDSLINALDRNITSSKAFSDLDNHSKSHTMTATVIFSSLYKKITLIVTVLKW